MKYIQVKKEALEKMLSDAEKTTGGYYQGQMRTLMAILEFGKEIDSDKQKVITKEQLNELIRIITTYEKDRGFFERYIDVLWEELK